VATGRQWFPACARGWRGPPTAWVPAAESWATACWCCIMRASAAAVSTPPAPCPGCAPDCHSPPFCHPCVSYTLPASCSLTAGPRARQPAAGSALCQPHRTAPLASAVNAGHKWCWQARACTAGHFERPLSLAHHLPACTRGGLQWPILCVGQVGAASLPATSGHLLNSCLAFSCCRQAPVPQLGSGLPRFRSLQVGACGTGAAALQLTLVLRCLGWLQVQASLQCGDTLSSSHMVRQWRPPQPQPQAVEHGWRVEHGLRVF
jgi:hypothetical protein